MPADPADDPADHGTQVSCPRCTGSGCPEVAATVRLSLRVDLRRAYGPAQPAEDLLRTLADTITGAGDDGVEVGGARYTIEQIGRPA